MHERWYADSRDLVKWASLIHLAQEHDLQTIIQVGFVTRNGRHPRIACGSKKFEVQGAVWRHFRSLGDIRRLAANVGIKIVVYDKTFQHRNRDSYLEDVKSQIERVSGRKLVFLDPNTGLLEVARSDQHIANHEVTDVWRNLRRNDWLVLYQHAWRERDWVPKAECRFRKAVQGSDVRRYQSNEIARDVVFLAAKQGA